MSEQEARKGTAFPEVAFYYPGPMWHSSEVAKNLLLFFDGIALLVPSYIKDKPEQVDPSMAEPLLERGLLHKLEPEVLVDKEATSKLAAAFGELLNVGKFDDLRAEGTAFHELSYSRLGGYGDPHLADQLIAELKRRNLVRDSEDGVSVPMHPVVRGVILVLLSQILRSKGPSLGFELSPITDRPQFVDALSEFLQVSGATSSGQVVQFDLETVAPDLSSVPLDEVLSFRSEHLAEFKRYARSVRSFSREISRLEEGERERAFRDRQDEIREQAADLKRKSRGAWARPASFVLGFAGAVWAIKMGDPVGALFSAGVSAASAVQTEAAEANAYSYLFSAKNRYSY